MSYFKQEGNWHRLGKKITRETVARKLLEEVDFFNGTKMEDKGYIKITLWDCEKKTVHWQEFLLSREKPNKKYITLRDKLSGEETMCEKFSQIILGIELFARKRNLEFWSIGFFTKSQKEIKEMLSEENKECIRENEEKEIIRKGEV